jgi:hypothetical protein
VAFASLVVPETRASLAGMTLFRAMRDSFAMPALNSSCLSWVEYDSGTMQLRFRSGRSYTLRGVVSQGPLLTMRNVPVERYR